MHNIVQEYFPNKYESVAFDIYHMFQNKYFTNIVCYLGMLSEKYKFILSGNDRCGWGKHVLRGLNHPISAKVCSVVNNCYYKLFIIPPRKCLFCINSNKVTFITKRQFLFLPVKIINFREV